MVIKYLFFFPSLLISVFNAQNYEDEAKARDLDSNLRAKLKNGLVGYKKSEKSFIKSSSKKHSKMLFVLNWKWLKVLGKKKYTFKVKSWKNCNYRDKKFTRFFDFKVRQTQITLMTLSMDLEVNNIRK